MLLNPVLENYLSDIESAIRRLIGAYIERYEEEVMNSDRVNIRIRIRMANESLLEINEAVVADSNRIRHLGYRYQGVSTTPSSEGTPVTVTARWRMSKIVLGRDSYDEYRCGPPAGRRRDVQPGWPHHKSTPLVRPSNRLCRIVVRASSLHSSTDEQRSF